MSTPLTLCFRRFLEPGRRLGLRHVGVLTLLACLPLVATGTACAQPAATADPAATAEKAAALRDEGLALLENEKPEIAEGVYRRLVELLPREPLGHGNLAIALLRQQKHEAALVAIDAALALAPGRADLQAIRGEVLQWQGDLEGALRELDKAARAAPDDPELVYAAYQLASELDSELAVAIADRTLRRLAELRPENVVVLLQLGQAAIARGDRATATVSYQRVGELLWQAQPMAERALGMVTEQLEGDDLSAARVPAMRLENVVKVSPMFRECLRELKTGIQGIPVAHFLDEPPATDFGPPGEVSFRGVRLSEAPTLALRAAHLGAIHATDDPEAPPPRFEPSIVRVRGDGVLEILGRDLESGWRAETTLAADGATSLHTVDLDNDGRLDLAACGGEILGGGCKIFLDTDGGFTQAEANLGLPGPAGPGPVVSAVTALDFDIDGDLDLVTAAEAVSEDSPLGLWRNALDGPLEPVGHLAFPTLDLGRVRAVVASDLDRDGDVDLAIGHRRGVTWLVNLRQGRFEDRSTAAGLGADAPVSGLASADLDGDGRPELIGAGLGLRIWRNLEDELGARFEPWRPDGLPATGVYERVLAFDADNDGRVDLAAAGPAGLIVLGQTADGGFRPIQVEGAPSRPTTLDAEDLDGDGDLDLLAGDTDGLVRLENVGGDRNGWLRLALRGLDKGSSKNNFFGIGSSAEVRGGTAYQFREADREVVHFGLGDAEVADVVRVVWTNGVPQNRLAVGDRQQIVEEQLLKGSCPFLYAWDGEGFRFVTDLLWGAPLGLPAGEGVWITADASELVRVDGLVADDGEYRLRITEELWEAAFFDKLRLWVVDHPMDVEVASNLRIVPGGGPLPEEVRTARDLRPLVEARDGQGRDVTERVRARDEVYADGYRPSRYQGVAEPWTFTFDLGDAPTAPIRLWLDGWIFPADASLNLAIDQRDDLGYLPPRLEVEVDGQWRLLMPSFGPDAFGHPAGKTKTMVVDTPPLPAGARRLRLVTSLWLHWDRVAWTPLDVQSDEAAEVRAMLEPATAELRRRGFSRLVRSAPNAPHAYDYADVRQDSPWIEFPGGYTRYGQVLPLLEQADDFSAVLAPGDEMAISFDASSLEPPAEGMRRTLFLESWGWDKDADRNTWEAPQVEPYPFHAMGSYPYPEGVTYPDTPEHRRYVEEWQTRTGVEDD